MARPIKEGLDYFPLDVDIYDDEKLIPVLVKFGLEGEVITIRLLAAIYRKGYFVEWTNAMKFKLARSTGLEPELIEEIIHELVKWGMFDEGIFAAKAILTSRGIQKRYLEAKRHKTELQNDLNLINTTETPVNTTETPVNATETPINVATSAQRKVKESKVKESKGEVSNSVSLKEAVMNPNTNPHSPDYDGLNSILGEYNRMILTNAGVHSILATSLALYGSDAVRFILTRLSDRKPAQYNSPQYVLKVIDGEVDTLQEIKKGKLDRFGRDPRAMKKTERLKRPKGIPFRFTKPFDLNGRWWCNTDPIHESGKVYYECIREDNGYISRFEQGRIDALTRGN